MQPATGNARRIAKRFVALALLGVVSGFPTVSGITLKPAATMRHLARVWLGGDASHVQYCRLALEGDGTGTFIIQYVPRQPAQAYRISRTRLTRYTVEFEVAAIDVAAEPIFLHGTAYPYQLQLELGGTEWHWRTRVVLDPHEDVIERIRAVDDRAERLRKEANAR